MLKIYNGERNILKFFKIYLFFFFFVHHKWKGVCHYFEGKFCPQPKQKYLAVRGCSSKLLLWKILQFSKGNTFVRVSLGLHLPLIHRCFPVNIAKFLRIVFLKSLPLQRLFRSISNAIWSFFEKINNDFSTSQKLYCALDMIGPKYGPAKGVFQGKFLP